MKLPTFAGKLASPGGWVTTPPQARGGYYRKIWLQRQRWLFFLLLMAVAGAYGFVFALYGRYFLVPLAGTLVIPVATLIWLLPERGRAPTATLTFLFSAVIGALLLWPDYLAISLPFLPWITMLRLFAVPMTLILVVSLSVSRGFRQHLWEVSDQAPWVRRLALVFVATLFITLPLSRDIMFSFQRVALAQINWTAMFMAALWVFSQPKNFQRLVIALWPATAIICGIGVWESFIDQLPWANHIPSFLAVGDESVQRLLAGSARAATGIYRVQSKFGNSLVLGEYLGLVTPFFIHGIFVARHWIVKILGAAMLVLIAYVVHRTDSRLAMLGLLLSGLLYLLVWASLRWRDVKGSLFGPAVVVSYPLVFAAFVVGTFVFPPLTEMVWGGGAEAASNQSRRTQWMMGMPHVLVNPIGHGVGQSGNVIGFSGPSGIITVDSFYLTLLVENGVVGFVAFVGAFLFGVYYAGKTAIRSDDAETRLLMPLAIALFNFIVVKSVLSQQENHSLAFVLLAAVPALMWRARQEERKADLVSAT